MLPSRLPFPALGHEPLLTVAEFAAGPATEKKFHRLSHSTILQVTGGSGSIQVDFSTHPVSAGTWIFLGPYQPFALLPASDIAGTALHFHFDFLCLEKHGKEVGCNDVLFNSPYLAPIIRPDRKEAADMVWLLERLRRETSAGNLARHTLTESYLKSLLVLATRVKLRETGASDAATYADSTVTGKLRRLIDYHYREKRAPKDYASLLNLSPKALGRLTKAHWNKTLSEVLQERMMVEAKRELYLTDKPVKRIARDLGFNDEYYFSRFFKKLAKVSPQLYRETVGENRG